MRLLRGIKSNIKRRLAALKQLKLKEAQALIAKGETGLYFGNLHPEEVQNLKGFIGLALYPRFERDLAHDACNPLPFPDNSVPKVQSQDVFEHLDQNRVPAILDEIYRVLKPGGRFRLSMPDYRSPLLRSRCAFDDKGAIMVDLRMGGHVTYDLGTMKIVKRFDDDGEAHVWFPVIESVKAMIDRSALRNCAHIDYLHYITTEGAPVVTEFSMDEMPVMRAPPHDDRANGWPISIIVDFVK